MANRMKEDEKNEKIIRGLLRLPANRRCINCNSLGPQYVCTSFWTFICTNCSGIHREFTHRVKSVSMAKFTSQEVKALQEGGNEHARDIYFKEWDPQRHSFPDSSNVDRLRDFIKRVYVDRRFTGERSVDGPPMVKGDREDLNENRRFNAYQGGSRSPPYDCRDNEQPGSDGRSEDRSFRPIYEESRSPGYDQGDYRKSPGQIGVVDERGQGGKFGNRGRSFEEWGFSDGLPKPEGRSPNHQKYSTISSPPMVRPVGKILGEGVPPLWVGEPSKAGSRVADGSSQTERNASSGSAVSADGNLVESKSVNLGSLIDFSTDPEPPVPVVAQKPESQETTNLPATGWASFDFAMQQKPQAASNVNTLESTLAQLSAPGSINSANVPTLPPANFFTQTTGVSQWPVMQQNQPAFFSASDSSAQAFTLSMVVPSSNQSWASSMAPSGQGPLVAPSGKPPQPLTKPSLQTGTGVYSQPGASSVAPSVQGFMTIPTGQPSQAAVIPSLTTSAGVPSQPHSVEAMPSGRRELPADLFTATFSPALASVPGWQPGQHAMGYGMQYPTALAMHSLPTSSKSANPFDLTNEPTTIVHTPLFPSMSLLQGALPNMVNPSTLVHSSSFGVTPPRWVFPQQPPHPSAIPPSMYMVQQSPGNMLQAAPGNFRPMGHQGIGTFSGEGPASGTSGMDQNLAARYYQPGTSSSFSTSSGNPFG